MNDDQKVIVLRALADKVRLSIVRKVASSKDEISACNIVACSSVYQLSQPAMSHHFSKLVDAGALIETKRGTQKFYELNDTMLKLMGISIEKLIK